MAIPKMKLPSKIITEAELIEREELLQNVTNGHPDQYIAYFKQWQRLIELNHKHMDAVLYVTAYN